MPSTAMSPRRELSFEFQIGDKPFQTVYLRSKNHVLTPRSEAYVAATLLPAMKVGTDLAPPGPIDPEFADSLDTIQDIYSTWYDEAEQIEIDAEMRPSPASNEFGRTATFFTGGVDSFYTLLKHRDEIDALVYVHGFDVELEDEKLRTEVSHMLQEVGSEFDKEVIEVETNLRDFSNPRVSWGKYHGAALAVTALSLQTNIDHIFVPSSLPYNILKPWGSNPLLDPLWSTQEITFDHDGPEANRLEKCQRVGESDIALQFLRVCWRNPNSVYNCGRCEKCIRTMIQLRAAGALNRCSTFERKLDLEILQQNDKIRTTVRRKDYHYREPLHVLRQDDEAGEIAEALEAVLNGPTLWERCHNTYRRARHRVGNLLRRWGLRA